MSNSPTNPPQNPTTSAMSQQEMQELTSLRREKAALSGMLWELVRQAAPETHDIEVKAAPTDPLWQLAFVQSSDPKGGKVRILAGTIKPISEQEKKRVVRLLRGTTMPMDAALTQLKLQHYPPSYVEKQIEAYLAWDNDGKNVPSNNPAALGTWKSVTPPSVGESAKNIIFWPK